MIESTKCDENLDQATGILGLHVLSGEGTSVAGHPGFGGALRDELKAVCFPAQSSCFAQESFRLRVYRACPDDTVSFTPGFSQVNCAKLSAGNRLNGFPFLLKLRSPAEAGCE